MQFWGDARLLLSVRTAFRSGLRSSSRAKHVRNVENVPIDFIRIYFRYVVRRAGLCWWMCVCVRQSNEIETCMSNADRTSTARLRLLHRTARHRRLHSCLRSPEESAETFANFPLSLARMLCALLHLMFAKCIVLSPRTNGKLRQFSVKFSIVNICWYCSVT